MTAPTRDPTVDEFATFLSEYYRDEIGDLAQAFPKDSRSLYVEFADLYRFEPALAEDYLNNPQEMQSQAEQGLGLVDIPVDVDLSGATVRLTDTEGMLDARSVTGLSKSDIGDLVAVEGQLSRITGKSPRLDTGVYECQRCGTLNRVPQARAEVVDPHECHGCERQGPFQIDAEDSEWADQRKIKLEEPIEERSQARGQSLPVYVEGDLCDDAPGSTSLPDHAGEHATVIGVVRVDESQLSGRNADPETELWVEGVALVFDADSEDDIDVAEHREEFEQLATRDDAVDLVAESLAPSLHADEGDDLYTARRAAAAWLFNAYRVDPDGSGSKRGDMHMCFIGDPGTGKSTLMSYLADVTPQSEFRSGTGLSEVGLTAAAVQEEFAGTTEWTLQPGILPRADGGHCIIDEIDGVVDESTKAIHDALEGEQMVKTDKAGIQADLPTRTALLAGGNPVYTRFDKHEPITEQIDLDPALFDRMDLVFALEDEVEEESDARKAEHSLDSWDELTEAEARARNGDTDPAAGDVVEPAVPKDVLRAWIKHARDTVFPTLSEPVKEQLRDFYVEVRDLNDGYDGGEDSAVPATMRTLESGIRLAIAFARLRLSDTVEQHDAERAIRLTKDVVGLNYDPETGEFDSLRSGKGTPKSQKDRLDAVRDIVDELGDKKTPAPESEIREAAKEANIDPEAAMSDLQTLSQHSRIVGDPSGGWYAI